MTNTTTTKDSNESRKQENNDYKKLRTTAMPTTTQFEVDDVKPTASNLVIINTLNHLVDRINILSDHTNTCMKISNQFINQSSQSINFDNNTHAIYVYNRSLLYIKEKLIGLKQSNQGIIKSLYRLRCSVEKLIYKIIQEIATSNQTDNLRIKSRRNKNDDVVQQVINAECQLLKSLKCSLESKLQILLNTIKNIKCIQHKLDQWIIEHEQSADQCNKFKQTVPRLTTIDNQDETLDEVYTTSLNLEKVLKTIESTSFRANTLQLDLTLMFDRIEQVISDTRNSVFYALTGECTLLTKQMSNNKFMQKLLQNDEQLQTVRSEINDQYNRFNQYLQVDLNIIRMRRKQHYEQMLHSNNISLSPIITKVNLRQHTI
ncbi:hypothetical protein MN116_003659 [Schistosoma mekongi]|uniref:Uncharacterized protein n=1 Tax=Schistosoma mekongi TaxID=38744 RepID=A0AAE1ZFL7_SCHME|nr:hypothetical protein MN116_003659 [Schistosoma mekongi]